MQWTIMLFKFHNSIEYIKQNSSLCLLNFGSKGRKEVEKNMTIWQQTPTTNWLDMNKGFKIQIENADKNLKFTLQLRFVVWRHLFEQLWPAWVRQRNLMSRNWFQTKFLIKKRVWTRLSWTAPSLNTTRWVSKSNDREFSQHSYNRQSTRRNLFIWLPFGMFSD